MGDGRVIRIAHVDGVATVYTHEDDHLVETAPRVRPDARVDASGPEEAL